VSRMWCDDPYEERRDARDDFERRGRYGYDRERYGDRSDACNEEYTREFDRLRREDDRRQEEQREQEEREHARQQRARHEEQEQEEALYYQQQQYPPVPEPPDDEPAP
jgi:hypothetical protein